MRIRKRQVPFPLSQVSPDPNRISRSPVMVQLNQAAPADVATSSKRSCTDVSAAAPAHSLDPSQPSDQTLHPPIGEDGELARLQRKKKEEYLVEDEDGKTQEEGEGGQKGNDTRKACNMGSEAPPDALSPSSTTCKQDLRWREVEKAIPLKKRRGEFDNNMEENISDSNRKKTNKIQSRSSRTKMNMAWEQDDDEIIKEEEKEAEEEVVAVDEEEEEEEEEEKVRERIQTKKVSKKKRVRGGALMEGSRCSRVNGRGWRCCQPTLVGYSLCEHHLGKGRLRSMTSVRSRSIATPTTAGAPKKLHRQLVPPSHNEAANSSSSYSNNNAKETNCVVARHDDDGYANHHAGGGGQDDHDDEKKPVTVTTKKRVKLGTVKARSISSLLGQTNNEITMPDNNNNNNNNVN